MSKTVFISRRLDSDSPMLSLANNYAVCGESLLSFTPVAFSQVPKCDWIFFYSQQGVKHFFAKTSPIDFDMKVGVFGEKTAQACRQEGIKLHFIGNGKAEPTSAAFILFAAGAKVLFARAKDSLRSVQALLKDHVETEDLVVYDNKPKEDFEIPNADIIIFTSPLNARVYFSKYAVQAKQVFVAIGHTTEKAMRDLGVREVRIPDTPTEESIVALINSLEIENN